MSPGFDINQPVTNPELAAALDALVQADTPATRQQVADQIGQATYLAAILDHEVQATPGAAPGQVVWQVGSRFAVLLCDDGQGGHELPLFTDWAALRRWTARPVSGLVLPAAEAWLFVLAGTYSGAALNPGGAGGIVLSRAVLERLAP